MVYNNLVPWAWLYYRTFLLLATPMARDLNHPDSKNIMKGWGFSAKIEKSAKYKEKFPTVGLTRSIATTWGSIHGLPGSKQMTSGSLRTTPPGQWARAGVAKSGDSRTKWMLKNNSECKCGKPRQTLERCLVHCPLSTCCTPQFSLWDNRQH